VLESPIKQATMFFAFDELTITIVAGKDKATSLEEDLPLETSSS
jgi:hypothetical protein